MIRNKLKWIVKKAVMHEDYTIHLLFADRSYRVYNMRPLLKKKVFAALKDQVIFMSGKVIYGTVTWDKDIDIAPEELYYNSVIIHHKHKNKKID